MRRRGFMALLASLPFVGGLVKAATPPRAPRSWRNISGVSREGVDYTFRSFDGIEPTHAVVDLYVPAGRVWAAGGVLFVPAGLARRFPKPDAVVLVGGASFAGWNLEGLLG